MQSMLRYSADAIPWSGQRDATDLARFCVCAGQIETNFPSICPKAVHELEAARNGVLPLSTGFGSVISSSPGRPANNTISNGSVRRRRREEKAL